MIYTSYYANLRNLDMDRCIGISNSMPRHIHLPTYPKLFPPYSILHKWRTKEISWKEFSIGYYNSILRFLDPEYIEAALYDKILLCWERNQEECHRSLVRKWLNYHGFQCEEITPGEKSCKDANVQHARMREFLNQI